MIDANKETETTYNSSSVNVCLLKNVNVHVHGTALITASLKQWDTSSYEHRLYSVLIDR